MAVGGFDGGWLSAHLGDPEVAALFSDAAELAAMVRVEAALAAVQGEIGMIPPDVGARLAAALDQATVAPEDVATGTTRSGIPVPDLVAALRRQVDADDAPYLHFGATTQDIIDTGLVLRLAVLVQVLDVRLAALAQALADQAAQYRDTLMMARTWGQAATPTTLGLRIAGWLAPLLRLRERLDQMLPRVLVLQWGGASGTLASMGVHGPAVEAGMAARLGLACPLKPWQTDRDGVVELAGWFSLLTGVLGKMGADLKLMAATGEARAGTAGSSSTMPQKANPVGAEALLALARFNAAQIGGCHAALVHAEERDAGAWQSEWLILPQMAVAAGAALRHAQDLADTISADPGVMQDLLARQRGTVLAEAAQFALAAHMPRPEATALVKRAVAEMGAEDDLFSVLRSLTEAPVDWDAVSDPRRYLGMSATFIDRVLTAARAGAP